MKYYCIINLSHLRDAQLYNGAPIGQNFLPEQWRPGCFFFNKDEAETELFRLSEKYDGEFYLFESTEMVVKSMVNLTAYHIEKILTPEDELPF